MSDDSGGDALVPSAPAQSAVDAELEAISQVRRSVPSQYHKNSELRARERLLIAAKHGIPLTPGSDSTAERESSDTTGQAGPNDNARNWLSSFPGGEAIVDDWDQSGGFDLRFEQADETANRFLDRIDPSDRNDLIDSFGVLDAEIVAAVMAELALPAPTVSQPLTSKQINKFETCEVFAPLFREFGHAAPAKLAKAVARFSRALSGLDETHQGEFLDWFDRQPAEEQRAIVRGLVR